MKTPDADLLAEAAPHMDHLSGVHCAPLCQAYHGVWGYMRLFGTLPSVGRDHHQLMSELGQAAAEKRQRILVSGAADFGILAYVIAAYEHAGVAAEVTVADYCATPLAINGWYAAARGWDVQTWQGDIRQFPAAGFDLVVAHNFLNFFDPEARVDVAKLWARAMVPGGRAVVFAQIKPGAAPKARRFGAEKTEELVATLLEARATSPDRDRVAADHLANLAREFAERRVSNAMRTEAELTAPLVAAGLNVGPVAYHDAAMGGVVPIETARRCTVRAEKAAQ